MRNSKRGFTIIEVVVVLAVAGLIIGIVLWAIPGLQKNSRDRSRTSLAANVLVTLDTYAGNNNGNYPTNLATFQTFIEEYYPDENSLSTFLDASGSDLSVAPALFYGGAGAQNWAAANAVPKFGFYTSAKCAPAGSAATVATVAGSGPRNVTVIIALEQGTKFCADNS